MPSQFYGYARCSTHKQELSIPAQETRLREYCAACGIELQEIIKDEAQSAGKIPICKREDGKRLCQLIDAGSCKRLYVIRLDRIFRSTIEALDRVEEWRDKGCDLHVLDFGGSALDTSTATGRLMLTFLSAVAQFERDVIGERTREAMQNAKANGRRIWRACRIPYGFRQDDARCQVCGGLEPMKSTCTACKRRGVLPRFIEDENEQIILRAVKNLAGKQGKGPYEIAHCLDLAGHKQRNGSPFHHGTVQSILQQLGFRKKRGHPDQP